MLVKRDRYLNQLIRRKHNRLIKIITGIRRCGKSVLLFELFVEHLLSQGVDNSKIIAIALDDRRNQALREPDALLAHILNRVNSDGPYYILLDEVQYVLEFEDVLNTLLHIGNTDVYVTGSNSRFLSSDIVTEFRGRGDQIRMHPFSFSEFLSGFRGPKEEAWREYYTYGGLPQILTLTSPEQKKSFLQSLFQSVYVADIIDRYKIRHDSELVELLMVLASGIGGLTNPHKLEKTFRSKKNISLSYNTISKYLEYLQDAFLLEKATRYDIKGKRYINSPYKYYFSDTGLRNALLEFRQTEENHLMENILFNELRLRGFSVDTGLVPVHTKDGQGRSQLKQFEIDFVANKGDLRYYIQSTYRINTDRKRNQEVRSLTHTNDSFRKILIVGDSISPYHDEDGILNIGIQDFLLGENGLLD